ncbi:MAG: 1,4-dihydroxy-2-naphthoate polyprenyltransferase [Myxococcota bacterium]
MAAVRETATPEVSGWRVWRLAARPRTLPVAFAPVLVGTALAASAGCFRPLPALATLAAALLLQIGANLANDLFDHERGADGADRLGPPRAMQHGLVTASRMRGTIAAVFGAAVAIGAYLVAVGGWPIAAIGLLSVAAGLSYTGGPWPFGYRGLGDVAVFVFFGLVAVCGSYYVQALALTPRVLASALPIGAMATAILVVNNLRDIHSDARVGKRTLAVRVGPRATRVEYVGLLVFAYALLVAFWLLDAASAWILLPLATVPRALRLVRVVTVSADGSALNEALAATAQLSLMFALLFSAGWLL